MNHDPITNQTDVESNEPYLMRREDGGRTEGGRRELTLTAPSSVEGIDTLTSESVHAVDTRPSVVTRLTRALVNL